MSQVKYWVVNPNEIRRTLDDEGHEVRVSFYSDDVIMTTVLDEGEVFEPPPPVRHGIETHGWRVLWRSLPPSGLNDMATVDWRTVATSLADALEAVWQADPDAEDEAGDTASKAIDDYRIAEHEEALRTGPVIEEVEREDGAKE